MPRHSKGRGRWKPDNRTCPKFILAAFPIVLFFLSPFSGCRFPNGDGKDVVTFGLETYLKQKRCAERASPLFLGEGKRA